MVSVDVVVEIAKKLNLSTSDVMEIMRHGQVVSGQIAIQFVLIGAGIVLAAMVMAAVIAYISQRRNSDYVDWDDVLYAVVVIGLISFAITVIAMMSVYDALVKIAAPDYAAIREILNSIGKV